MTDEPTVSLRKLNNTAPTVRTEVPPSGSWPASASGPLGAPPPLPAHFPAAPDNRGGSRQPWAPGAPPATPRPEPSQRGGRRATLVAVAAAVVLAAVATVIVVVSRGDGTDGRNTASAGTTETGPVSTPVSVPASADADATTLPAVAPTIPPTPTPTLAEVALPTTTTPMNLVAIRTDPRLGAVARMLDTYFTGINRHDPDMAASAFATGGVIDSRDPDEVAQFGRAIRTSRDDRIVVTAIRSARFGGRSGALVSVNFRSRQAPSLGPNGQACTRWTLNYRTVGTGAELRLLRSVDVDSRGC